MEATFFPLWAEVEVDPPVESLQDTPTEFGDLFHWGSYSDDIVTQNDADPDLVPVVEPEPELVPKVEPVVESTPAYVPEPRETVTTWDNNADAIEADLHHSRGDIPEGEL